MDTIIRKRKHGITISFMKNDIPYMQDHGFWRGIPTGVEFFIEECSDSVKLIGEGYGALKDNRFGLRYNYGNGAIYVLKDDLIKSIITPKQ